MTKKDYGENQALSARREKERSTIGSNHADGLPNLAADEGDTSGVERSGSSRATTEGSSSPAVFISVNGKLARQLRKHIQAQLAEKAAKRQEAIDSITVYEQSIEELQQDLEGIEHIIEQLNEAEKKEQTQDA